MIRFTLCSSLIYIPLNETAQRDGIHFGTLYGLVVGLKWSNWNTALPSRCNCMPTLYVPSLRVVHTNDSGLDWSPVREVMLNSMCVSCMCVLFWVGKWVDPSLQHILVSQFGSGTNPGGHVTNWSIGMCGVNGHFEYFHTHRPHLKLKGQQDSLTQTDFWILDGAGRPEYTEQRERQSYSLGGPLKNVHCVM